LDLQLPVQLVPITTNVVSSNLDQGDWCTTLCLAYLEPVKIKLNKHYIYSNFSKFKKISTVANDNLEKVKTIY
jgi:hypothetical protein